MKIAVFATGWNGEYLRDMYHGLENSQKEFHDSQSFKIKCEKS